MRRSPRTAWLPQRSEPLNKQKKSLDRAAEAHFTKKQKAMVDASQGRKEYEAAAQAVRDKTARLRSLRKAKEEADLAAAAKKSSEAPKR
jgi:hypothetical protein